MATRIQVRRGTTSEWNTADPTLQEGEFGYNTTLDKFKIGDGSTAWSLLEYIPTSADLSSSLGDYIALTEKGGADGVAELDSAYNVLTKTAVIFEGTTVDAYETTLQVTDPTADRTITLPNSSGTVALTSDLSSYATLANPTFSGTVNAADLTLSGNLTVNGTTTTVNSTTVNIQNAFTFEGTTADAFETTLTVTDPTADRTITLPDATGTVQLRVTDVDDTEIGYLNGVTSAIQTQLDAKVATSSLGTGVATFLGTPTSANLAAAVTGETGSGALVFGTSPTLRGPFYIQSGGGAGGSNNYITTDNSTGKLSIVSGYPLDLTASGDVTITATGGAAKVGSDTIATLTASQTLTTKTLSGATLTGTLTAGGGVGSSGQYLESTGTGVRWTTVSGYSAPTLGSTSIASGATVTTIAGLTLTAPNIGAATGTSLTATGGGVLARAASTQDGVEIRGRAGGSGNWEVILTPTILTADQTLTLPNETGTVLSTAQYSAKGVILIGTGTGTLTAQSVGTNGQVLTANSAQADGIEWTTPAAGAAFSEFMLIGA